MKKILLLGLAAVAFVVSGCNYNHYSKDSPYRGQIDYQHEDETVVRPTKKKTMTVKRDLTTTEGGTVHTKTVTETVVIPDGDVDNADEVKKVQRAINADQNYYEIDINKTRR